MAAAGRIEINTSLNRQGAERDFQRLQSTMKSGARRMKSVGETMSKAITVPLAGLGAAAISSAKSVNDAQAKIQSSLGVTKKEAENLTNVARNIYKAGFGESLDQVSDALIQTKQNMKNINSEAELQTATKNALALAKAFDTDVNEVTRGGGQLMQAFGIDSQKAFDLMAYGADHGLDFSNELFDNLSEYAPLFAKMGYSADEYFKLLIAGSNNGAYNLDYVNDVFKEFQIRVKDGSKSTEQAMGQLSSGTQKVWKDFLQGKGTVKDVANAVLPELKGMDDQVAANNIGVALFGTKWEDLEADALYSMGNINGSLDEANGAMGRVTKAQEESFGQRFQKALRSTAEALVPIGNIILDLAMRALPYVEKAIKVVSDAFNSLSPTGQAVVVVMGGIAAAIGLC
nr:phage tail tape measure protein [Bacillus subtilis]